MNQHSSIPGLPDAVAAALARRFEHIVVFSGAGMSAESGIPTFRASGNALWGRFRPEELATPEAWHHDKAKVWGWYMWRRHQVRSARPHAGHLAVAQLQQDLGASVITQNVDDLHERAGCTDVLHLHGSLFADRCFACGKPRALDPTSEHEKLGALMPPRCAHCNGFVRPGVVWFGEQLPEDILAQAKALLRQCDLLLVVGTSGVVQPAASLVELAPPSATLIEVNPEARADAHGRQCLAWASTAAVALPLLHEALLSLR